MAGFPPSVRLRRAADFAAMRNGRGRVQTRHFTLRWMPSATATCRMGMAVSRKVSKRAVVRNVIKRITRESFRAVAGQLPGLDVLVIAKPSAGEAARASLRSDLDSGWAQLQALKDRPAPGTIGG